jgi:hypothetical protein
MAMFFNLCTDERAQKQIARDRREALKACAPFKGTVRVDYEASMIEGGVVTCQSDSPDVEIFILLQTLDEAVAFAAEANGTTQETVEKGMAVEMEYLNTLRRKKRR